MLDIFIQTTIFQKRGGIGSGKKIIQKTLSNFSPHSLPQSQPRQFKSLKSLLRLKKNLSTLNTSKIN